MSNYARANRSVQWFASKYPGAKIDPNCGVLHTTESTGWPGYEGGATAPNYTGKPNFVSKRLDWRAHFPDEMSSRALKNLGGGVNTNTANVVQVELIGTCDHSKRTQWKVGSKVYKAGVHYIYWPDAPQWALDDLAAFVADMHKRHGVKIQGPKVWLNYGPDDRAPGRLPASYGASPARMSFGTWRGFYGWCGHQHVPENAHGDPGALDWPYIEAKAKALVAGKPSPVAPVKPNPTPPVKPKPYGPWGLGMQAAVVAINGAVKTLQAARKRTPNPGAKRDGVDKMVALLTEAVGVAKTLPNWPGEKKPPAKK